MARIQSKSCGRKPPREPLLPREIKAHAEEALVKMGRPSRQWGSFKKTQDFKTQDARKDSA